ncbi:response regulator [Paenibacillus sp. YN15]|uniref:ATP-binding response regulator n=1 Tax=Paenibacillus sp. YN15 TaxID=1742774 RepID=UPI00215C9F0E|nr:response regulator [Paenibacillus sp. YN15]
MEPASPVQILLVDDHPENLLALEAVLSDKSYQLVKASSGHEALRKVLQGDFAVIVLDVHMPDMDGLETAKYIKMRERSRDTPIIFITAADQDPAVYFSAYALGAIDYIRKPFVPEILKSKIDGFVSLHRTSMKLQQQKELLRQQTMDLEKANVEVHAASLVKTRFLATMSHEIRTPLNGVIGVADLLLGTQLDEEQRMYVETIKSSGDSLLRMLNDILDFAKMETGKLHLSESLFDLHATVMETVDLFQAKARLKGVELIMELSPEVAKLVSGDEARLRQILMNLIGNGVKFTNKGSVSILMRPYTPAAPVEAASSMPVQWVEFEITDTGEGIPAGREDELFRPFTQLSPYMTRHHDGTGLGLSICKLLVELMGGNIRFEHAASGQGATFIFTACLMVPQTGSSVSDSLYTGNSQVRSGG